MRETGCGNYYQIQVRGFQHVFGTVRHGGNAIFGSDAYRALIAHVADGLHLTLRVAREIPDQVRPPITAPDQADTKSSHRHSLAYVLNFQAARPEFDKTTGTVLRRILRSSQSDHRRTYCTSSSHIWR